MYSKRISAAQKYGLLKYDVVIKRVEPQDGKPN